MSTHSKEMFTITPINSELVKKLDCHGTSDYVEVTLNDKSGYPIENGDIRPTIMTEKYRSFAEKVKNFKVYEDDIWVITFPKCGTTWAQEMVWLIANDLNFDVAKRVDLNRRFPFLE